jgi:HPt (histidine-containing phosphotransfer) domain-containing protein
MATTSIAFDAPDNARGASPSKARPIDLVHLARQTMGDKALEAEVLRMFARQIRVCLHDIGGGDPDKVKAALHLLKGSAHAVGAFPVAEAAAACEARAGDPADLAGIAAAVLDAENFILRLSR